MTIGPPRPPRLATVGDASNAARRLPPERRDVEIIDDPALVVSDPRVLRLYAHLETKRAGRAFASPRDLDPLEFPYILGNIILVDVLHEPLRFRYRLIGTNLILWRGNDELTGTFLHDHPDVGFRELVVEGCTKTVTARRATGGIHKTLLGDRIRDYEVIRVPLSEDGVTISTLLLVVIPK